MATALTHSVYPCSFVHGGGTLDLDQMESFQVNPEATLSDVILGGTVDRAAGALTISSAQPNATLATRDLATLLATVDITAGLAIVSTGAVFRSQQRADGSTFSTGAAHNTWTSTKGFLYPTSITATQDDEDGAICNLEYRALWDGSTLPFVVNANQDFDLITDPAFGNRYYLGPVYLNGVQIPAVTSVTINTGIGYIARSFNGDAFPKVGAITTRRPSFEIEVADFEGIESLGLFGNAAVNAVCYLQHAADNSTRVAAATTSHCKFTASAGDITPRTVQVTGPTEDGSATITVIPEGTIAFASNSAIP